MARRAWCGPMSLPRRAFGTVFGQPSWDQRRSRHPPAAGIPRWRLDVPTGGPQRTVYRPSVFQQAGSAGTTPYTKVRDARLMSCGRSVGLPSRSAGEVGGGPLGVKGLCRAAPAASAGAEAGPHPTYPQAGEEVSGGYRHGCQSMTFGIRCRGIHRMDTSYLFVQPVMAASRPPGPPVLGRAEPGIAAGPAMASPDDRTDTMGTRRGWGAGVGACGARRRHVHGSGRRVGLVLIRPQTLPGRLAITNGIITKISVSISAYY